MVTAGWDTSSLVALEQSGVMCEGCCGYEEAEGDCLAGSCPTPTPKYIVVSGEGTLTNEGASHPCAWNASGVWSSPPADGWEYRIGGAGGILDYVSGGVLQERYGLNGVCFDGTLPRVYPSAGPTKTVSIG